MLQNQYWRIAQEGKKKEDDLEDDLSDEENVEDLKKPLTTTFELNDTLFAEAELEDTDTVYLWLGVSLSALREFPDNIHLSHQGKRYALIQTARSCITAAI
jgi:hypothetical protein